MATGLGGLAIIVTGALAGQPRRAQQRLSAAASPCSPWRPSCRSPRSPISAASSPTPWARRAGSTRSTTSRCRHRRSRRRRPRRGRSGAAHRRRAASTSTYLGRNRAGAARRRLRRAGRRERRPGRPVRRRQDDAGPPADALLGPGRRDDPPRRPRPAGLQARRPAPPHRAGRPGHLSVQRHAARPTSVIARPGGVAKRTSSTRSTGRRCDDVRRQPARGPRHAGRRARHAPLGRPAPARRHRPRLPQGRAGADPRRSDLASRRGQRAGGARRARRADERAHHRRHRPPPLDRAQRRPDRRDGGAAASSRRARMQSCSARVASTPSSWRIRSRARRRSSDGS